MSCLRMIDSSSGNHGGDERCGARLYFYFTLGFHARLILSMPLTEGSSADALHNGQVVELEVGLSF